jgi:hypothetical protein
VVFIKKVYIFILAILFLVVLGCNYKSVIGTRTDGSKVVATVDNDKITVNDVKKVMQVKEIQRKLALKTDELNGNPTQKYDDLLKFIGSNSSIKKDDAKRFVERIKRISPERVVSENDAFNELVRQLVLYREAVHEGYNVSTQEAKNSVETIKDQSRISFESQGKTRQWQDFISFRTSSSIRMS